MFKAIAAFLAMFIVSSAAYAQTTPSPNGVNGPTRQAGAVTSGHCVSWKSNNYIQDSGAACGSGGTGSLTITDGVHTVAATTNITVTGGGTVGGTSPNATLTITGGGGGITALTGVVTASGSGSVVTSFGTFSSATLAAALTDETGTGSAVFANAPTISGALGFSSATVSNGTLDNLYQTSSTATTPLDFYRVYLGASTPEQYYAQSNYVTNENPTYLNHFRGCASKVATNTASCHVLFIGDSTTLGRGADRTQAFNVTVSNMLNQMGLPANWESNFGCGGTNCIDTRFSTGWIINTGLNSLGGDGYGANSASSFTFTNKIPADTFKVWYQNRSVSDSFSVSVDGGSPTTITGTATNTLGTQTFTTSLGIHTLTFTWISGVPYVQGIEPSNSAVNTVILANAGWNGATSTQWNTTTTAISPLNAIGTYAPDLCFIDIGINDWDVPVAISTYTTNMQAIITKCLATGDAVLVTPNPSETNAATQATQATFVNAMYGLALTNNIPIIDNWSRFQSWTETNTLGLQFDQLHLNQQGYIDFGNPVGSLLASVTEGSGTKYNYNFSGQVTIGATVPHAGVALDLGSTTNSLLLPTGTTGQRPTGVAGMLRYNTDTPALEAYYNNVWNSLGGGGGGSSLTVTDGTHSVGSTATITMGNGFVVGGSGGSATISGTVSDNTKSTSYTATAADMANALNLTNTGVLTLPAASSTIFAPGMSTAVVNSGTGNWTLTNSTGLTITGLNSTTLVPGFSGTFVANANGTGLDFFPGMQPPTTTVLGGVLSSTASSHQFANGVSTSGVVGYAQPAFTDISGTAAAAQLPLATTSTAGAVKPDGTTITISGGVITASGGSATTVTAGTTTIGGTCTSGFNLYNNGGVLGCQANGGGGNANAHLASQTPSDPTGNTSTTTAKMMGLGSVCTITPHNSGAVNFIITGVMTNSGGGVQQNLRYGTGTAPANAAAVTGTTVGNLVGMGQSTPGYIPFALSGVVTGLTVGTAYWFDVSLIAVSGGTAADLAVSCAASES